MTEVTPSNTQSAATVTSDDISINSGRSSSQTSRTSSNDGRRTRTVRASKHRDAKATPSEPREDPFLTSFPSLSPEPDAIQNLPAPESTKPGRTASQVLSHRKATLAGLTNASPSLGNQKSLFDDSPRSSFDIPGSLHLASDEHIERMLVKSGPINLIRQYAKDLAQRDAELSALRTKADARERELKRLLREANVPSAEVERRLFRLDDTLLATDQAHETAGNKSSRSRLSLDGMMQEAITDARSLDPIEQNDHSPGEGGLPNPPSVPNRTTRGSKSAETAKNSSISSRVSSRASSVASQGSQDLNATVRPRQASSNTNRVSGLQSIFQPPSNTTSYFIGGTNASIKKPKAVDEISVRSNQSAKSSNSWARFFGGSRPQQSRSRASSLDQPKSPDNTEAESVASKALMKVRTQAGAGPTKSKLSNAPGNARPQSKRSMTATRPPNDSNHARKESNASSLPPTVELDSMIESSQLPPTMANHNVEGILTDRFGFIYDRKRKRQQMRATRSRNKPYAAENLAAFRHEDRSLVVDSSRPDTPLSMDDDSQKKSWQDYLLPSANVHRGRPKELLAHTPSASAVVTVSTAEAEGTLTPPRHRDVSISVSSAAHQAMPSVSSVSEPQSSTVMATSSEYTHDSEDEAGDASASKALLDQLTDMHDSLQADRTVKWNDFLRRVRTERANATDRTTNNAPEADLVNGELVGIATLGRSSKTKAKYLHFKSLVLSGIPVALRPKIWAECSGAISLRIPGYYEDLVVRSVDGSEIDEEIAIQIKADVKRTLRDNIFFRSPDAPGVQKLEELLRAYSLHNPRIGYCQGMNLITASLLLICATSEDCFWLLVAIVDHILPSGYFDHNLLVARADQIVLRQYVEEVLPKLAAKLQDLGVELEACTFHWFLSLFTGVLTGGEALYRVWDVVLCLNSSDSAPMTLQPKSTAAALGVDGYLYPTSTGSAPPATAAALSDPSSPTTSTAASVSGGSGKRKDEHDGTSSPFLFQLSLALLKLNENAILALGSPAMVYTYLNHNMTAHDITIDALVNASEMLRGRVKRTEVLERRKKAIESLS